MANKTEPAELIPVWVHQPGIKGFDVMGNPVDEMEVNQYGFVTKLRKGVQPADTDALQLKSYTTRQLKAET